MSGTTSSSTSATTTPRASLTSPTSTPARLTPASSPRTLTSTACPPASVLPATSPATLIHGGAFPIFIWSPPPPSLGLSNLLGLESLLTAKTSLESRGKFCPQRRTRSASKVHLNWGEIETWSPEIFSRAALRRRRRRLRRRGGGRSHNSAKK